jgi:hypothetical protein
MKEKSIKAGVRTSLENFSREDGFDIYPLYAVANLRSRNTHASINSGEETDELFGIWKDRDEMKTVDGYIRNLRKGRNLNK